MVWHSFLVVGCNNIIITLTTHSTPVNPYLAQSLVHGVANLLVVSDALLGLLLLVLRVPQNAVLRPARHRLALRLRGSRHQTQQKWGEGGFQTHLCYSLVVSVFCPM